MPIPYDDVDDVEELGLAAYLRIVAADDKSGYAGALFVINARGEPIEFTYNRIETHHSFQVDFLGVQKLQSLLGVNLGNFFILKLCGDCLIVSYILPCINNEGKHLYQLERAC